MLNVIHWTNVAGNPMQVPKPVLWHIIYPCDCMIPQSVNTGCTRPTCPRVLLSTDCNPSCPSISGYRYFVAQHPTVSKFLLRGTRSSVSLCLPASDRALVLWRFKFSGNFPRGYDRALKAPRCNYDEPVSRCLTPQVRCRSPQLICTWCGLFQHLVTFLVPSPISKSSYDIPRIGWIVLDIRMFQNRANRANGLCFRIEQNAADL